MGWLLVQYPHPSSLVFSLWCSWSLQAQILSTLHRTYTLFLYSFPSHFYWFWLLILGFLGFGIVGFKWVLFIFGFGILFTWFSTTIILLILHYSVLWINPTFSFCLIYLSGLVLLLVVPVSWFLFMRISQISKFGSWLKLLMGLVSFVALFEILAFNSWES